ncbi:MAG: M36 family metallopeptidase [Pyrinomonadaceae bacterium]
MNYFRARSVRWFFLAAILLGVLTAVVGIPFQSTSKAAKGLFQKTESHEERLPNYDIRSDKSAADQIASFRSRSGKSAVDIADARDSLVLGENILRRHIPTLKVDYNSDIQTPEVIAPNVQQAKVMLTGRSEQQRSQILINFLSENTQLVGSRREQVSELKVTADYTNPDGNLSFVQLAQEINGIPVFRGEVKAGFTKRGEMFRIINNLAPGLDYSSLSTDFGDPSVAADLAAGYVNADSLDRAAHAQLNTEASTGLKAVFGTGDSATTAEKMYFPTEPGVAIPAWRVLIWQPVNAYYVIVDAATGAMLWRKNITEDQTQSATYSVYANPNAMINVAHSPFPFLPLGTPAEPNGVQGVAVKRRAITRIGNEAPYTFNNLGWITDGDTKTDGNAIQAGLDRDGVDGVDPNSEAVSGARNFTFAYRPYNPNTQRGDAPVPASQTYPGSAFQQGAITQLFYIGNWFHDETYQLGFTEQAGNFQNDNFGRGGLGGDRVRGEGQDSSGTNNANFSTPADGGRGRMQMYIWSAPNPDIDGNLDADVVIHELTHGLSNRLHGNGSGLSLDIARGMGEGWSDFYAHCLLSEPTDPINAVYTIGAYDTYLARPGVNNYYYGIRRFPKAVMAFTGGPMNRPHNPLTFADIDATKINISDGAFSPSGGGIADQVHNIGEVWSIALWEIRARMMQRLTPAVGNRRILQLVTDGMKLAPLNPTPLSERDAMIAAALASGTAGDVADIWAGFALRGFGAGASIQALGGVNFGSGNGTVRVTEAFDLPNLYQAPNIAIADINGNNNGVPEPGETVTLTIPLTNSTGINATGTTLQIAGGGLANYGTINHGATVSRTIDYTVPAGAACGAVISLTLNANSSLGPASFTRTIAVGSPVTTFTENFDGVTAPAVPAGWSVSSTNPAMTFVSTTAVPDSGVNSMFATDPASSGGSTELISPSIAVNAQAANVTFRHKYDSESGWDGGVLDISIAGGAFQDIIAAGGTFLQNGYNGVMAVSTGNPFGQRAGWTGNSGGYITSVVRLPAAANGQNIQLRWRFGADSNTAPVGGGWNVDTIQFAGNYGCAPVPRPSPALGARKSQTLKGRIFSNR